MKCKICNKEFNRFNRFSEHLINHQLNLIEYYIKFKNFKIPKCLICDKEAKNKNGIFFRKTCGNKICINKLLSQRKLSSEHKLKIKIKRIAYLKNHPEDTAWRLGNKMSYPEKYFSDALKKNGYFEKFEIIREKSFFPYYADFAFENVKVVVEIDGSQHNEKIRKRKDIKKDNVIQKNGWRVIRFSAQNVINDIEKVLTELNVFIGNINILSCTSKIISGKQKKLLLPKKIKFNLKKQNYELFQKQFIEKIYQSKIDFSKLGWVGKVAEIINQKPQKVNSWMKRFMNNFYQQTCFKRVPSSKRIGNATFNREIRV